MKRILGLFLICAVSCFGKTVWVTQAGAGTLDGSSLANAFSASKFNTAGNWGAGAGKISPADLVKLSGTFTSQLIAQASGTSTSARTIIQGDGTAVLPGVSFGALSYLALIGVELTQTGTPAYATVVLAGATGCLIQNNYIHTTYQGGVICSNGTTNNNNIVRGNRFYDINGTGGGVNNSTCIIMIGNANLVEYNTVGLSEDRTRCYGTANVVRNNAWGYTDTTYYPNGSQNPSHTDGFQSNEGSLALVQFLYDSNYDTDNKDSVGGTNSHGYLVQDSVGTNGFTWAINRFNINIRSGGSGGAVWQNMAHVYTYNNTVIASSSGASNTFGDLHLFTYPSTHSAASSDLADVRNTLLAFSPNALGNGGGPVEYLPTNFSNGTNLFYNSGTQASYPAGASPSNLAHVDPLFTDGTGAAGHDDYSLTASSPARGAGSNYITASGAGASSTSLTVTNAQFLFDGWGTGADADWIKIGSGAYVQITSINYGTNVVTLSSARSWSDGDAVIVRGMTDVGALPYRAGGYALHLQLSQVGTTYTVSVYDGTNADASDIVRFVQFFVDGIPQDPIYTAPYTITSSGTVTASAYSLYSSQIPVISSGSGSHRGGLISIGGKTDSL